MSIEKYNSDSEYVWEQSKSEESDKTSKYWSHPVMKKFTFFYSEEIGKNINKIKVIFSNIIFKILKWVSLIVTFNWGLVNYKFINKAYWLINIRRLNSTIIILISPIVNTLMNRNNNSKLKLLIAVNLYTDKFDIFI